MSLSSAGFLVSSYSCSACNSSFLYFTRSLYICSISSGRNPLMSLRKNAPLGVMQYSVLLRTSPLRSLSTIPFSNSAPLLTRVSGDMLYCMIRCGYSELRSNDTTQLCIPTSGSLTYAPSYLSVFSCSFLGGITMFFPRR